MIKKHYNFTNNSTSGFTLLELLIAISIFAVLSGIAYTGFGSLINTKTAVDTESDNLVELQKAVMILERDLVQASPRSIRVGSQERLPAMLCKKTGPFLLEFTRNGWRNPIGMPRSNLQRVAYKIKDNNLVRLHWINLDRVSHEKPTERTILSGVTGVKVKFYNLNNKWVDIWPQVFDLEEDQGAENILPRAVSVNLNLEKWGDVDRVFITTGHGENWKKQQSAIVDGNV